MNERRRRGRVTQKHSEYIRKKCISTNNRHLARTRHITGATNDTREEVMELPGEGGQTERHANGEPVLPGIKRKDIFI